MGRGAIPGPNVFRALRKTPVTLCGYEQAMWKQLAACALVGAVSGCAAVEPPRQVEDACAIFADKPDWWRAAKRTEKRWGASPALQLAIIRQESGFNAEARPPRQGGFLFFPGRRPSTAFGYAQALETTWSQYQSETGRTGADRDEFDDASDFVGWYVRTSIDRLRIGRNDARAHYLAYHEGHGGYARGTYKSKAWLLRVAAEVDANARAYDRQLDRCEGKLNRGRWLFF